MTAIYGAPKAATRDDTGAWPVKVAASSLIGTTIEWYDYYIFGIAAVLVFSTHFFPNLSPLASKLASMTTFAVAFVARPFGGIVFGHFGDRIGRKVMLVYSIGLMGAGTFVIGLLPTYEVLGIWAAVLLVTLRFIQGFAVGGEWGGAVLMALEHAPPARRAFYASWPQCGVPCGLVLSSGTFYLVQRMPAAAFEAWGWRIPFIASFALIAVGLYVRLQIPESPEFLRFERRGLTARFPVVEVLRHAKAALLVGIFSIAASNAIFWMATVYFLSYGVSIGIPRSDFFLAVVVGAVVEAMAIPAVAVLADRFGRKRMMIAGAVAVALVAFPVFGLLNTHETVAVYGAVILSLGVAHAISYAVVSSFVAELFAPSIRYTGAAMAYQLGGVVTSAPIPIIATYLYARTGGTSAISWLLVFAAFLTVVAVALAKRPRLAPDVTGSMPAAPLTASKRAAF